ncbi:hypothetical protein [Fluviispira vulneris]|uniref:hypothetical protein n=1 Tax=Fluviispira vulneris TaxID=2763012 RepID=UPI001647B240|nr:hypothetical protein [Fluviispira vulneris]
MSNKLLQFIIIILCTFLFLSCGKKSATVAPQHPIPFGIELYHFFPTDGLTNTSRDLSYYVIKFDINCDGKSFKEITISNGPKILKVVKDKACTVKIEEIDLGSHSTVKNKYLPESGKELTLNVSKNLDFILPNKPQQYKTAFGYNFYINAVSLKPGLFFILFSSDQTNVQGLSFKLNAIDIFNKTKFSGFPKK